ncbi:DNA topoisomerase 1 [Geodia barretti]|uniref:DNA topoisomerase n=1 Tax=Geodia barretti TaxID=519541 RepID=A0AA35W307_GEOBA|nr:DNA topoisomerase 1 [Geodia barretti]
MGTVRFRRLESYFGTLEDAWKAGPAQLREAGLDWRTAREVVAAQQDADLSREMDALERAGVTAAHWNSDDYPARLKEIPDPPPVIYYLGEILPEDEFSVAVVGTRNPTSYGREAASALSRDLASVGITIVSGLALGIDGVSHRAALECGGRTIAVVAGGLDSVYPKEHAGLFRQIQGQGAVISEHRLGVRPDARNFPRRNRLISGMTLGTLVVEAGEGSGYPLDASKYTNRMIKEGAKLVAEYTDVLEELKLPELRRRETEPPAVQQPLEAQEIRESEMEGDLEGLDEEESAILSRLSGDPGHVRDLPQWRFGVNIEEDFAPSYEVVKDKKDLVSQLKAAGDSANDIYLATDPDREGEAISWHLQEAAAWEGRLTPPKRVVFHEITKDAVEEAFNHPREIDMQLVNAQQARRILDRLVGYQISPLLRKRVQRGVSAGRVQSVALRMVSDREREIAAFVPVESWTLDLRSVKGQRARLTISKEEDARRYEAELDGAKYAVAEVSKRDVRQRPAAPFTTSTMQQEAGRKLRFTSQRTMSVAQQLYEGLNVGDGGSIGLITYMRTDSTQVAASAVTETREYIAGRYGKEFRPDKPRVYSRRSKAAQEAHEAIRPTSIHRDPTSMKAYLNSEQLRLYTLVWERMLASQMSDAVSESTTVDIDGACRDSGNVYNFRATGSVLKFAGFRTVYLEGRDETTDADEAKRCRAWRLGIRCFPKA